MDFILVIFLFYSLYYLFNILIDWIFIKNKIGNIGAKYLGLGLSKLKKLR